MSVAAGDFHTVAVRADGTLWTWGDNSQGQLGNGSQVNSSVPVQVGTGTSWANVAAGASHALGVTSSGSLYAWGNNTRGQLGTYGALGSIGTTPELVVSYYYQYFNTSVWVSAEAGESHTVAVRANGMLWAWGDNGNNQLGIPTTSFGPLLLTGAAEQVGTATNWVSLAAGSNHSAAIRADGTLWTWGDNYLGQLGVSTGTARTFDVPTQLAPTKTGRVWRRKPAIKPKAINKLSNAEEPGTSDVPGSSAFFLKKLFLLRFHGLARGLVLNFGFVLLLVPLGFGVGVLRGVGGIGHDG
jgi:alpha-tubulin suppressor-like RCC1 family protein